MELLVSFIYTLCGISYTIFAGYGKYVCFIFGLISAILYSYLSFKNALWGSFALNFLYYIPIQIISLFKWYENTDKKTKTVKKTNLNRKTFIIFLIITILLSLLLTCILSINNDKSPVLDGLITIFSMLGAYLTLKRALEQWIIWSMVNILTFFMWVKVDNYIVALLWIVYFILGIIFYFKWKSEINSAKKSI